MNTRKKGRQVPLEVRNSFIKVMRKRDLFIMLFLMIILYSSKTSIFPSLIDKIAPNSNLINTINVWVMWTAFAIFFIMVIIISTKVDRDLKKRTEKGMAETYNSREKLVSANKANKNILIEILNK